MALSTASGYPSPMIRRGVALSMVLALLGCATDQHRREVSDHYRRDFSCSGAGVKVAYKETRVLEDGAKARVYDVSGCMSDATYMCPPSEPCFLIESKDLRDGPCCEQEPDAAPGP
jgi:hypothetical protein